MTPYHYFGTVSALVASLLLATANTHAAVWLGASSPDAKQWVQAGIGSEASEQFVYIETRDENGYRILRWPARFGETFKARLAHRGNNWSVTIAGHSSVSVQIRNGKATAMLEVLGNGSASGTINGVHVAGTSS